MTLADPGDDFSDAIGVGRSVIIFETIACTVDPANGGSPVSIS